MKKIFSFFIPFCFIGFTHAQNIGIGTTTPAGFLELKKSNQIQSNIVLSGQEYFEAGNSASGISLLIGLNRIGNKQLWLADLDVVGS